MTASNIDDLTIYGRGKCADLHDGMHLSDLMWTILAGLSFACSPLLVNEIGMLVTEKGQFLGINSIPVAVAAFAMASTLYFIGIWRITRNAGRTAVFSFSGHPTFAELVSATSELKAAKIGRFSIQHGDSKTPFELAIKYHAKNRQDLDALARSLPLHPKAG